MTLADDLVAYAEDQLTRLVEAHLPGFRVPGVFAGHQVLPDVRADLAFTLGLLWRNGVRTLAGTDVEEAIGAVLAPIDGPGTHSFSSYRVAETVAALEMLDDLPPNVAEACDSTSFIPLLHDAKLPRNYAAVLARCELARQRLGLLDDTDTLDDLVVRTADLLAPGYLDDSQSRIGRYDIYTADSYLFTEPLGGLLGDVWDRGARQALDLVARTLAPDGSAVTWGRSTGALAACLTIELGGLARRLDVDADHWHARAQIGFDGFTGWMSDGLVNAHQHRSTYGYRGPFRRLQMTLDCLGKLAAAALDLRGADPAPVPREVLFPERDELVHFDAGRNAGIWTYRSHDLAFVLPVVGATVSDYLPAPHQPGLFEVPVGTDLPTGVPTVFREGVRFTAGQLPAEVDKIDGGLRLRYDGFAPSGVFEVDEGTKTLSGQRDVTYRVAGRTLHVDEVLRFDEVPDAVALSIAETTDRPLVVAFSTAIPHAATTIDTSGIKEHRSFWAELPVVHQLDLDPAPELHFSYEVTPKLRVLTTARRHHYHRSLYDPLADRVVEGQLNLNRVVLGRWDLFHLHWPEWLFGTDLDRHQAFIAELEASGVRTVWTQHNLVPHDRDPGHEAAYQLWAEAAHGVVHHSRWGMDLIRARYDFRPDAVHRVIPHGHFGNLHVDADRADVEAELCLMPGKRRLGIIGAPRPEKDVGMAVDAFVAAGRDDLELLVLSLGPDDEVPDRPGVVARTYEFVEPATYNRRLAAIDVLVLPFAAGEMLTTGTVGDAIGLGIPTIASDWPYLVEVLGDAAIVYGQGADALRDCIRDLDDGQLARAGAAAEALQPVYDWATVAEQTHDLLEAVGTTRL